MSDPKRILTLDDGRYVEMESDGWCSFFHADGTRIRSLANDYMEGHLARALARYENAELPEEPKYLPAPYGNHVLREDYDKLRAHAAKVTAELAAARKDAELLDWVQKNNMALIPSEHGGHGWMVVHHARAVGGTFVSSSDNPCHDPQSLRTAIKKAIERPTEFAATQENTAPGSIEAEGKMLTPAPSANTVKEV